MRSQPTCGCSEERALPAITLRNSCRVDWIVIVGHVTATLTPTAEENDRSGEKKAGDRSMRQLASGQVSEVPGDKKDENLQQDPKRETY